MKLLGMLLGALSIMGVAGVAYCTPERRRSAKLYMLGKGLRLFGKNIAIAHNLRVVGSIAGRHVDGIIIDGCYVTPVFPPLSHANIGLEPKNYGVVPQGSIYDAIHAQDRDLYSN